MFRGKVHADPTQERGKEVARTRFNGNASLQIEQERARSVMTTATGQQIDHFETDDTQDEDEESNFAEEILSDKSSTKSEDSEDNGTISDDNKDSQYDDEWLSCVNNMRHGGEDFYAYLKSKESEIKTDTDLNTLLHIAAYEKKEDIYDMLLETYPEKINEVNKKKKTPLHIAAKLNSKEITEKLIKKKAERDIQDRKKLTPLLTAVRYDSVDVFDLLVDKSQNSGTDNISMQLFQMAAKHNSKGVAEKLIQKHGAFLANVTDENGKNLVCLATENNSVDVLKMLLEKNHTETFVNNEKFELETYPEDTNKQSRTRRDHTMFSILSPDKQSNDGDNDMKKHMKTPLHIAAQKGYLDCLNLLVKVREVHLFRKSEHGRTALHLAAANGYIRVVEALLKSGPELKNLKDESKRTAIFFGIKHVKVVEILINSGAKVNIKDKRGRTPISYAAEKGLLECTNKLIECKANINLEDENKMRPIHYAAEKGQTEVFRVLLEKTGRDELENSYWNCLDLAIDENQVEIAYAIFHLKDSKKSVNEKWKIMLRSRSKSDDFDSECFDTPMRKLIRKMPDVAKVVFDKCTQINSKDKKNFEVTFDYEFLDDAYHLGRWRERKRKEKGKAAQSADNVLPETKNVDQKTKPDKPNKPYTKDRNLMKKNHPLMIMVKSKQTQLLDHPLVSALLRRKWMRTGFISNIVNFFLYAAFLVLLTGFAISLRAPYEFKSSPYLTDVKCSEFENERIPEFARIAQPGIIFVAGLVLLIEVYEVIHMFSGNVFLYAMEIENVLEWITCITAICFVVDITGCGPDFGYKPPSQWICGTVSVFFAWTNMLFIIQKFDWFGIYVVMLKRIIKMFTKFFLVFSLLIVAFASSFHSLFQNQQHFSTFWISLMKTTSMMIGGPDFVTTFLDETVYYEPISYAFFYGFMLLMAIVVINLLVGLAVSNIQEFHKKANLAKKQMQVKFTLELERIATSRFIVKTLMKKLIGKPIQTETFSPKENKWLQNMYAESWKLSERHILAAMNTDKDDTSRIVARLDIKMKALETKLETRMKYVDEQLMAIMDKIGSKEAETGKS